jgi:hypothetical protein
MMPDPMQVRSAHKKGEEKRTRLWLLHTFLETLEALEDDLEAAVTLREVRDIMADIFACCLGCK